MADDIIAYLEAIDRDACYRVESVLKESPLETTELVSFVGANGAKQGPYVRKRFDAEAGLGAVYARIMDAQRAGSRFLHLPRVFDCYELGRERAVVMEYVAGETLADVVYRCDPSLVLAADLFPRLCDAVAELHERFDPPIVHRDLKPSNIIVTADALTLIDFGIARTYREGADDDTRHFGTRAYAPPEQFGFGQTSVRSDVYALGMLLCYCLTEQTPDAKVREGGFVDERIPANLRPVLAKATAFDPAERFASARELKESFLAAAGGYGAPLVASAALVPEGMRSAHEEVTSAIIQGDVAWIDPVNGTARRSSRRTVAAIARGLLALSCMLLWVTACIMCALDPQYYLPQMHEQGLPRAVVAAQYILLAVVGVLVGWVAFDRRYLEERYPRLPKWPFENAVRKCVIGMAACLLAVGVLPLAF